MDSWRGARHRGSYVRLENNNDAVSQLAQEDKVPWYHKPNLRFLYLLMFPTCLGVEMTSGQVIALRFKLAVQVLTQVKF